MSSAFVHLRLHTEFSLSDGMVRIKPLIEAAVEKRLPAVAITDNTNLFGQVKLQNAALEAGIKPIVASDVWLAAGEGADKPTPLVLIARNNEGYRNLTELLSEAYVVGRDAGRAYVTREMVARFADGLIALSGGRTGAIGQALLAGNTDNARALLADWMSVFPDAFYLELHRTGRPDEENYLHAAVELAAGMDCPVVATNDVCFLTADDFEAHEVRVCIHDGHTLDDPRRESRYSEEQYLKSPEEMFELFSDIPEAIENTVEIARRCNVDVDLGNNYLPNFPIPEGYTTEQYLEEVSRQGLDERLEEIFDTTAPEFAEQRKPYDERLQFELNVINSMGFPGYFLVVMEFIQWAKENSIPVGPGRGSGAGSLVAYALQITNIDPLEYDLLFERFLNPERVSLPDFDIDFCMDGRDRVINHVMELYGRDAVSQIITFGTMAAKAVVRDVARVQGKPYGLADKLSKLIPFDPGMTLSKAMEIEPLLREFVDGNEEVQEIMDMAYRLEGLTRNVGKHAGGVVISPTKITDYSPIYCDESGSFMTQYNMSDVEQAGLVKFDFLGLRTLTIIDNAVNTINARRREAGEEELDIDAIGLEDPAIYQDLQQAKTTAVFQLESRGMKELMKQVKPNRFGDIVALVALFRPGPLQLAPDFIERKHGRQEIDYLHPDLKPVLEGTYGVMLYQEQVMQIAQILAGYSLADADLLRRAMGKKKPEEMAKQRETFVSGATARGVEAKQADHIFNLMEKFAGYGFNKPHSVCYALIAYQTAWLKHYYPADFMAAVLSADMQSTDKVVINIEESREIGVEISPPDVNRGEYRFIPDTDRTIIYGLGAIKGLGEGPIDALVEARRIGGEFKDLFELCERVDSKRVNKRAIEAMIGCGALDGLVEVSGPMNCDEIDYKRGLLDANYEDAVRAAEQQARNADSGVGDLFGDDLLGTDGDGHRYNHFDTLRPLSFKERLGREKETLGIYLTGHPLEAYRDDIRHLTKTRIVDLRASSDEQTIVGLVVDMRVMKTKSGSSIAFVTLDDRSARLEVAVFSDLFEQHHELLKRDAVLVVKGATSNDDFSGGLKMRASEIHDLTAAREKSVKRLRVMLDGSMLGKAFEVELAELLSPFRGSGQGCPVAVGYQREDASGEIELGEDWRVQPSDDLIQNLRDHYGAESISLDY